mgnify:CR=1 FL=1
MKLNNFCLVEEISILIDEKSIFKLENYDHKISFIYIEILIAIYQCFLNFQFRYIHSNVNSIQN